MAAIWHRHHDGRSLFLSLAIPAGQLRNDTLFQKVQLGWKLLAEPSIQSEKPFLFYQSQWH